MPAAKSAKRPAANPAQNRSDLPLGASHRLASLDTLDEMLQVFQAPPVAERVHLNPEDDRQLVFTDDATRILRGIGDLHPAAAWTAAPEGRSRITPRPRENDPKAQINQWMRSGILISSM